MANDHYNPYEQAARLRKAHRIADVLRALDVDHETAGHLAEAGWTQAAEAAEVRYPSIETRHAVIAILSARQPRTTDTSDDVFAGWGVH